MSVFITDNDENIASASWSKSHFEKNEYYTDFGLAKGQKKDGKSHGKKAQEQSMERQNKVAEQVSLLPKKMQAKLQEVVSRPTANATTIGKSKNAPITKVFYNRQKKAAQTTLLDDYAEHCLAEDDALNEVYTEAAENMYHQEMERQEEEEDKKIKNYQEGLELWLKYGLTKAQYDANREYEANVKALEEFYQEPDYWNYPDYEMRLKAAIKKFEDDFEAEQREQDLKDQQNDWWREDIDVLKAEDDLDKQNNYWNDYYEPEEDDEEADQNDYFESYEDWCERRREEDIEAQRQNAIDDMYDDY